jgi:hypothetical protein
MVEWLRLLLRIQWVAGSNLGPETGYADLGFSWFFAVTPGEWAVPFHIISNSSYAYPLILLYVDRVTEKASLNKLQNS